MILGQGGNRLDVEHFESDGSSSRPLAISWQDYSDRVLAEWYSLLGSDPEEAAVQAFLERHPAMVPGGSGDVGPGGHHGSEMSALIARPRLRGLGRQFEPDFMWVTRSSGLVTPVLIEIEKPSKRWFQVNGRPTAEFRDAHDQLNEWRAWFAVDGNKGLFRRTFLFRDQYVHLPIEPQFVLIYGRQSEFELGGGHAQPTALLGKRDSQRGDSESFRTFDSLRPRFDHSDSVTVRLTARGLTAHAFSPLYTTGPHTGLDALELGGVAAALQNTVMMTDQRRAYVEQRWNYWRDRELDVIRRGGTVIRSLDSE